MNFKVKNLTENEFQVKKSDRKKFKLKNLPGMRQFLIELT